MKHTQQVALWVLLAAFAILSFLLVQTVWQYLAFAIIFAILFAKPLEVMSRKINRNVASLAIVLLVFLLLITPTLYVIATAIQQAQPAYEGAVATLDKPAVQNALGVTSDEVRTMMVSAGEKLRANVRDNAGAYAGLISSVLLGLFVLFLALFFFLRDGIKIRAYIIKHLPMDDKEAGSFIDELRDIVHAIVRGQFVTAVVQGILTGIVLWLAGVPNPIFWAAITSLLSVIPVLGPFLVYIPAAGYLFLQDRFAWGIFVLAFGIIVLSQIDNIIRPYVASKQARIHPLVVILGVIGGLQLWGLVGFIIGPIVLAAFLALFAFIGGHYTKARG